MNSPYSFSTRLFLLFIAILLLIYFARIFSLPESWGDYGYYRGDYIDEEASKAMVYGGNDTCQSCHEEVYTIKKEGAHKKLSCELCHGPVGEHVEGKRYIGELSVERGTKQTKMCLRCHQEVTGRPETFPMVDAKQHLEDEKVDASNACGSCHTVHEPLETMRYVKRLRTLREGLDDDDE